MSLLFSHEPLFNLTKHGISSVVLCVYGSSVVKLRGQRFTAEIAFDGSESMGLGGSGVGRWNPEWERNPEYGLDRFVFVWL